MRAPSIDPPLDLSGWTDQDLRRTIPALAIRLRWIVEGLALEGSPAEARAAALGPLLAGCDARAASRAELESIVGEGESILRDVASAVATIRPDPGGPGSVTGLFRSDGGVPKLPVDDAIVDSGGVAGDRQATRKHHGRAWQALCLWSAEVIAALDDEGHPISPGAAGENITIAGLRWEAVRPGVRLAIGDEVRADCSSYAPPCAKNARWFTGGRFDRMDHERYPGTSRVYAWVRQGGSIRIGDPVKVIG